MCCLLEARNLPMSKPTNRCRVLAFSILRHSILQIVRQPVEVLRIFVLPLSASFLIVKLTGLAFTLSPFYMQIAFMRGVIPWGRLALVMLVTTLIFFWAAAAWHRFILLAERPRGFWPLVPWSAYLAFIRKGLLIGLLIFVIVVVASFAFGFILGFAAAFTKRPPGLVAMAVGLCVSVPIIVLSLRIAVNLPGAAIQSGDRMGEIWNDMTDTFWTLLGLMIALIALRYMAGEALVFLHLTPLTTPGFILVAVLESVQAILSLSILTTLYGHLVEDRPLA